MGTSETQSETETKLKRIALLSKGDPNRSFDSLMHHYNYTSLEECFHQLKGNKAVGIDGINKVKYAENLEQNLTDLITSMKKMAYRE